MRKRSPRWSGQCLLVWLLWGLAGQPLAAQAQEGDLPVRDSGVGYIDSAIPANVLRFRNDDDFDNHHGARGEYFYARPRNPGLPLPERGVDYQEIQTYLELMFGECCSIFAEVPVRFLQPEVNADAAGVSDINAGFKVALIRDEDWTWSFQFRTYAPTGDPHRGLGNDHVSLEPAILGYIPLGERAAVEAEFRYWIPIGGHGDFASDVVRYGLGVEYRVWEEENWRATPVLEIVGWTFLGGKDAFVLPNGHVAVNDAAGQTIVNLKAGMRVGLGQHVDVYGGYTRPLTGDKFYEQGMRVEMRFPF